MTHTGIIVIVSAVLIGVIVLAVVTLTAAGSRRRGTGVSLAVAAGLCFPITWVVWYLRDQRPYRRPRP